MAKNRVAANVLMLILIVGGLVTLASGIKQEVFPEVEMDVVSTSVTYPGASPAEVEQAVLLSIEEEVRGLDGVKEVTSTASEGVGVVNVEMLLGTNRDRMLADVDAGALVLPPGYRIELAGDSAEQQRAVGQLLTYVPVLATLTLATGCISDEIVTSPLTPCD